MYGNVYNEVTDFEVWIHQKNKHLNIQKLKDINGCDLAKNSFLAEITFNV